MCPKQHPRLVSHSFFPLTLYLWGTPIPATPSQGRGLPSIGGVTLRKEAEGGNPNTRRHGAHGAFHSSSSPKAPHPFGAVGIVLVQEDPPGSGGCGLQQKGTGSPGPCGRAHWLAHPPQLHQPHDSPSLGNKPAQASGM